MGLNKVRHFNFIEDPINFAEKKNMAVWRGYAKNSEKREYFIKHYYDVPTFDIGQHAPKVDKPWHRPYMPISKQLRFKFIFCIEGADTATNIKWVMSSNSVCVMPKPKYETWFMEGKLNPDFHYICLKSIHINQFEDYCEVWMKCGWLSFIPSLLSVLSIKLSV